MYASQTEYGTQSKYLFSLYFSKNEVCFTTNLHSGYVVVVFDVAIIIVGVVAVFV